MKFRIFLYVTFLASFLQYINVGSDLAASQTENKGWVKYTTENGLIGNDVTAYGFDHDGNAWIGTTSGLSRFNGVIFTNFTEKDGLASDFVTSIACDQDGILWIGTGGGISVFDGESWTKYTIENGLLSNAILGMDIAHDGKVWYSSRGVVGCFDGVKWSNYQFDVELDNPDPYACYKTDRYIVCSPNGDVWAAITGVGVVVFDDSNWWQAEFEGHDNDLESFSGLDITPDGSVWLAYTDRILCYENGTWRIVKCKDNIYKSITTGYDGSVWTNNTYSCGGSIERYDGIEWKKVDDTGPHWSDTMSVSPDGKLFAVAGKYSITECNLYKEGFWLYDGFSGTVNDEPVDLTDRAEFTLKVTPQVIIGNERIIDSIRSDSSEGIWSSFDIGNVYDIFYDDPYIWCVTSHGVGRFDTRNDRYLSIGGVYGDIAVTPDGKVWIGYRPHKYTSLYLWDSDKWSGNLVPLDEYGEYIKIEGEESTLYVYEYRNILPGKDSSLFMIAAGSILKYKNESWSKITNERIRFDPLFYSDPLFLIDNNDTMWFTWFGSLSSYTDGECTVYDVPQIIDTFHFSMIEYTNRKTIWFTAYEYDNNNEKVIYFSLEYDGTNWLHYTGEESEAAYYHAMARDGVFWKGDDNGLHSLGLSSTSVETDEEAPITFNLLSNNPNPFNPSTTIRFELVKESHVRLDIYSITGQYVDTLVNGTLNAGMHTFIWVGSDYSAGVYISRLTCGGSTRTGKMLLLK
ncbi:MAG: T9SS type A sorting domain-containing protein [Candidatus Latescibacteria bacterium]|nr:T9SS type A sorting domain-containing protein [Candidatus Latescibacterota bacterium]